MALRLSGTCDASDLHRVLRPLDATAEVIDLSAVSFVTPSGLVALTTYAASLREWDVQVTLTAPVKQDVANYLARSRLGDVLDTLGVGHNLPVVREHRADSLWELQSFSNSREVAAFAAHIHGEVARSSEEGADEIFACLCEAGDNVGQHSGQPLGYLAAQRYQDGKVLFAVGDAGSGFLHSLRPRGAQTDVEALRLALEAGVSAVDDQGRGYGLHDMARSLGELRGSMSIISGRDAVRSSARGVQNLTRRSVSLQGSVVSGMFPLPHDTP